LLSLTAALAAATRCTPFGSSGEVGEVVEAGADECDSPLLAIDQEQFDEARIPTGWTPFAEEDANTVTVSDAGLYARIEKSGSATLYRDFVGVARRAQVGFTLTLRGDASSANVGCSLSLGKLGPKRGPGMDVRLALEGSVIALSVISHSTESTSDSQTVPLIGASTPVPLTLSVAGTYVIEAGATTMGAPPLQTLSVPWDAGPLATGSISCGLSGVVKDDGGEPLEALVTDVAVRICP
jgi:hypothetical protein